MEPLSVDALVTAARWLRATNSAGETVPAHALVKPVGSDTADVYEADKPDADGQFVFVWGIQETPDGFVGAMTNDFPAYALYDAADGVPAVGETWGAGSGTFKLKKGKAGFRVVGDPDTTLGIVPVTRSPARAGFFARLTDSGTNATTSTTGWDFIRVAYTDDGGWGWHDDSAETTGYPAFPLPVDGTRYVRDPVAGLRVWVWPSASADGIYEFMPVDGPTSTACGGGSHNWVTTVVGSPSGSPADYTTCLGVLTLPRAGDYLIYFNAAGEVATIGAGYSTLSVTVKNAGVTVLGGRVAQWYASETPSSSTQTEVGGTASGVYPVTVSGGDLDVYLYAHLISSSLGGAEVSGSLGYVPLSDATVTTCDECEAPNSGSGGGGGDLDFYCFDLGDDLEITLSNVLGDCTDLPATIELTRYTDPGAYPYEWRGTFTFETVEYTARVTCPSTINPWGVTLGLGGETVTPVSQDEDTNTLIWDLAFGVGSACIGSARLTIVGSG